MTTDISDPAWDSLSYAEKNRVLFERQKKMLEELLERNAINRVQYKKSLHDLTEKMARRWKMNKRSPPTYHQPYPALDKIWQCVSGLFLISKIYRSNRWS